VAGKLGRYIPDEVSYSFVYEALLMAMTANGSVEDDGIHSVAATIQSGLKFGMKRGASIPAKYKTPYNPQKHRKPQGQPTPSPAPDPAPTPSPVPEPKPVESEVEVADKVVSQRVAPNVTAAGVVEGFVVAKPFFFEVDEVTSDCYLHRDVIDARTKEEYSRLVCRVPIWIGAILRKRDGEGQLLRVDFRPDPSNDKVDYVVVPRSENADKNRMAKLLMAAGVDMMPEDTAKADIVRYFADILSFNKRGGGLPRRDACSQFGWNPKRTAFLLGKERVGEGADYFWSANDQDNTRAKYIHCRGYAKKWLKTAEILIRNTPVAGLVLAASMAAPLQHLVNSNSIAVALTGRGGTGKSALLRLAASAWGWHGDDGRQPEGLVGSGGATAIELEGQFIVMRDLPRICDELRTQGMDIKGRELLQKTLQGMADGSSRRRAKRDGSSQTVKNTRGPLILATELDARDFLIAGGAVRRFLPMPAPYVDNPKKKLGVHADSLMANYGHAGRAFVEALVATTPKQREGFKARMAKNWDFLGDGNDEDVSENETSWGQQIALALTAIDVACELCPDIMPDHELWSNAVLACWNKLGEVAKSKDVAESADVAARAYALVLEWLATMRPQLLPSGQECVAEEIYTQKERKRKFLRRSGPAIGRIASAQYEGFVDEVIESAYIPKNVLEKYLATQSISFGTLAPYWVENGWLKSYTGKQGKQYPYRSKNIDGHFVSCYKIIYPQPHPADD